MSIPGAAEPNRDEGELRHRRLAVNGVHLHVVDAGAGPPVILLHGFPEFWYSWRHQIPFLAQKGFHVLAPDLRGYNESDRPRGLAAYRISALVADVRELIQQTGQERACVVGHDWGGVIAWRLAMSHPELVKRLVILNAPHPALLQRELRRPRQMLRSAYMLFFQLPWLPEKVIALCSYALLERMLRLQPAQVGAFSKRDIERYKDALDRRGARTAVLAYYRALLWYPGEMRKDLRPITTPTLVLWGKKDPYLGIRLTQGLEHWVSPLQLVHFPDASHWLQNEKVDEVNRYILAFLSDHSVP